MAPRRVHRVDNSRPASSHRWNILVCQRCAQRGNISMASAAADDAMLSIFISKRVNAKGLIDRPPPPYPPPRDL